jgi:hypothetical protein
MPLPLRIRLPLPSSEALEALAPLRGRLDTVWVVATDRESLLRVEKELAMARLQGMRRPTPQTDCG